MLGGVLKDKEMIEQMIEGLDRYKRDALKTTWENINGVNIIYRKRKYSKYLIGSCARRNFGGIFAELLPEKFAKLPPPDSQDLMDGLEIKVQLGSVWKQSLTELSGGQRCASPLSE
jgi:structural maintenance of chromosome 2